MITATRSTKLKSRTGVSVRRVWSKHPVPRRHANTEACDEPSRKKSDSCNQLASGTVLVHTFDAVPKERRDDGYREQVPVPERSGHPKPAQRKVVAESIEPEGPPPLLRERQSHGRGLQLRRGVQESRLRRAEEGHHGADDRLAGVVAGRLRPLRSVLHPHGLAQRGHLPHPRRARRRRVRARSASRRSTVGPTTSISTRPAGCSGRSSRSTAARSPGPT